MMQIPLAQAKAHLANLIRQVEKGEAFVITRHGRPVAELRAAPVPATLPLFGALKGQIEIAEDFDDLPEDFEKAMSTPVAPE